MDIIVKSFIALVVFATVVSTQLFSQNKNNSLMKKTRSGVISAKKRSAPTASEQLISEERLVEISTDYGVMVAKLYDSTPLHRDNFIKLVGQKFYDSLLFHRIIN